jgi:cbb3-type cytochrome oxidase maturation protein
MNILLVLIPVSLALAGIAIWAFFWAADSGQFDDLDTPALQALSDDEVAPRAPEPPP